jgi:hypothetical protein
MARTRTVDLLPQIFQTDANRQFLAATLDTLTQEPKFKKTQGFIGRTVGPGVNPLDRYVVELDKTRQDYQLEPAIVSLDPSDTTKVQDVMTYPGILDAVMVQGGDSSRPDRLFTSDYYTWDSFCDYDAFVNYSQYYWVPAGPAPVDVTNGGIPITDTYEVTRANGVYTFSGLPGENPTINLLRNGSYSFTVTQNAKETVNYRVRNDGAASYVIDNFANPTLTLARGNTYVFELNIRGDYPFWIKTAQTLGANDAYNAGVSRNGSVTGQITFVVPQDAPDTLYYTAQNNTNMRGVLTIVDGTPGTGPGFWIQTTPGVAGVVPTSPNISNRQVLGVSNNGEDLGTVTFNVPSKTAQQYFYDLPVFANNVDLITTLTYDQIQGQEVLSFNAQYGGIDGVLSLDGLQLIFIAANPGITPIQDSRQLWRISLVQVGLQEFINLAKVADIPAEQKFSIRYGTTYSNTTWYKTPAGKLTQVPLLTATSDTLYYQDGTDPNIFGTIKLVDLEDQATIFINEIVGQPNYTSPNGVVFTNGLKVVFKGDVLPASYASGQFTFDCTQTASLDNSVTTYTTEDLYVGQEIRTGDQTIGGLATNSTYYVRNIINIQKFTLAQTLGGSEVSLPNVSGNMTLTAVNYSEYYVAGVGTAIQLLPVTDFVVPELYVEDADDSTVATEPADPDYITIDRSALDRNAWSRSNRWFHIDVLEATARYNNTLDNPIDPAAKALRPIIQFRPGLRLFDMGTQGLNPVDLIDFVETDAFSNIEGMTSYSQYGYSLENGSRVIFANDQDPSVRNKIWQVEFITPDTIPPLISQPVIHLTLASDGDVKVDQSTVILNHGTASSPVPYGQSVTTNAVTVVNGVAGYTYYFDGTVWVKAQLKQSVQQPPLFNVYDSRGISFGDRAYYPSSDFVGTKLFSYQINPDGVADKVLGLPLSYRSIANVGDIIFDNNLYVDSFIYTVNNVSTTLPISSGTVREYASRTQYLRRLGWLPAVTTSQQYQQFRFTYQAKDLVIDIEANSVGVIPSVKVYVDNVFLLPDTYSYTVSNGRTTITLPQTTPLDSVVEVLVLSDQTSPTGFYQIPINLQNNPLNADSPDLSLGTIRQHYQTMCENNLAFRGQISGSNNTRDLGAIGRYGLILLQQSAPLTLAGYFLRSNQYNIFDSLIYNAREYTKFKDLMLDAVAQIPLNFATPAQLLDQAMQMITEGRTEINPFYWSDMIPAGAVYTETVYPISFTTTNTFDTLQTYNYTTANFLGLNVYLNDSILVRGRDYEVAIDGPRITLLISLTVGDTLTLREYSSTAGSFVPNTPSKMGLYPAYEPEITIEKTSQGIGSVPWSSQESFPQGQVVTDLGQWYRAVQNVPPGVALTNQLYWQQFIPSQFGTQTVIIGHDGSVTKTFGDIRDQVLLEFERRIYNNIKMDGNPVPLTQYDSMPGQFRSTGFSWAEIQGIFDADFLSYVAWNRLNYETQDYKSDNAFTYNYSNATNKLNNQNLLGAWRGIYRYFYDTQQPQYTPWEMLGFSVKPSWWDLTYGEAPYTSGNMVLWDDLAQGLVRDPAGSYVLTQFARPDLAAVIPTASEGQLLPPLDSVVRNYQSQTFERDWKLGDGGPVEASWWNSSMYPFAVMRMLAITRPAQFFALFADRDLYRFSSEYDQYLYNDRYRLDANGVQVYGNGVSKASFINWIVDYNKILGIDTTTRLQDDLKNLTVRLNYRMASFSDKSYIQLLTEKSSPGSTNQSFLIPDTGYDLVLYKNTPFEVDDYSAVLIQKVSGGWSVTGYSSLRPYFTIQISQYVGQLRTISVAGASVQVPRIWTRNTTQVPYGFVFSDRAQVADFLLSYGKHLESQGFTFANQDNGYVMDWNQMAVEFLYWTQQGWDENAIINLNPLAQKLSLTKELAVADNIRAQTAENILLDQNKSELPIRNLNVLRSANTIQITPASPQILNYISLRYVSYEHMILLQNVSEFGDLIYDPITGARQSRLQLKCVNTTEWNGTIDAQGFILNQNNVETWTGLRSYSKGEIVKHKGAYWSANRIVQPSTVFNYNDWYQSDYEQIEKGLLPNLANKSDQLVTAYDINDANIESQEDLFSFGLIGFKPRQYLADLNLDDISQVNVYRQFLGSKGTKVATKLLRGVDLGKEAAQYEIYENWAVQRAIYGANANRSFIEIRLDAAKLTANPSIVQIVEPDQPSVADQTVLFNSLWRQSFRVSQPDVLPQTYDIPPDISLPTAGYVDLDDADITLFDITDSSSLSAVQDRIEVGTTIWAAKVNDYDWNIYRAENAPGVIEHVCDNLDGTSLVIFSQNHGLVKDQKIIIKNFDSAVNGVYSVLTVPAPNKVTIAFAFTDRRTVVNGTGLCFYLTTQRVAQLSDAVNLPYANSLLPGAIVWVDDDGDGRWAVYQKRDTLSPVTTLGPAQPDALEQYGQSVAQALNGAAALIGSPRYGFASGTEIGGVYCYTRAQTSAYQPVSPIPNQDTVITVDQTGVRGLGYSVTMGQLDWACAGAPSSLNGNGDPDGGYAAVIYRDVATYIPGTSPYVAWQLLTSPIDPSLGTGRFGQAVAMSLDQRWLYVSSPTDNEVHAYVQVPWQDQYVQTSGNGVTNIYDFGDAIQINNNNQISCTLNGAAQTLGVDYNISGFDTLTFVVPPASNDTIVIQRKKIDALTVNGSLQIDVGSNFFQTNLTGSSINSFSIIYDSGLGLQLMRPNIDYTFNTSTKLVTFTAATGFVGGEQVVVRAQGYYDYVTTFAAPAGELQFGHSLAVTTDGLQILVGAPDSTVDAEVEAGSVVVFDRDVQRFVVDTMTNTFTVLGATPNALQVGVTVNGRRLLPETSALVGADNTFSVSGNTVTVNTELNVGDFVDIETNQFQVLQTLSQNTVAEFSNFGQALDICDYNCSLYVGAPQSSVQIFKGGVAERWVNQSRVYGIISSTNTGVSLTAGQTLRVNLQDVAVPSSPNNTLAGLAAAINQQVPNVNATVADGIMTLVPVNNDSAPPGNKLQVLPGTLGTVFDDLGFEVFVHTQVITSPLPREFAAFGSAVNIDSSATELVIGAPKGNMYIPTVFDPNPDFDSGATLFFDATNQSGSVYVYNYLTAANQSAANPAKFILGQQVQVPELMALDGFGTVVNYTSGILMMGAPGFDYADSAGTNAGQVVVWQNANRAPSWQKIRSEQPTIDIRLLNSVFLYDLITGSSTEYLDFFNPLQGKLLGAVQQNIDYVASIDPAGYNTGAYSVRGNTWGSEHVGEVWWDTSTVRFIDPAQNDLVYEARRWGQLFPGSLVHVYQWIESTELPANYTGEGTPFDTTRYTISSRLTREGTFVNLYYYWVRGITMLGNNSTKTLPVETVARYIEDPKASGIAYLAPLNGSSLALYNCGDLLQASDTVIHVEFDRELNSDNVHVEYELVPEGRADGFLTGNLYRKLLDSFCGSDSAGNLVPDPYLSPAEKYGVQFRPRQSMFADRFAALKNYIVEANRILALYPITEMRNFVLLNSEDPLPSATANLSQGNPGWNAQVATIEILSYQNIDAVPLGYQYLVDTDSTQNGRWTIYQVQYDSIAAVRKLVLIKVQNYVTPDYWSYIDWVQPGYNATIKPQYTVANYADLVPLAADVGVSVKVTSNAAGKFEIYQKTVNGWNRVVLEDGTIKISATVYDYALAKFGFDVEVFDAQYFDEDNAIETRKILEAINQELLIDDLLIYRNNLLINSFNFVLKEFQAPQWLVKTSLIDVDHKIRQLIPYQNYTRDNQEFVLDYLQEVKPYHVQVREFNLTYTGDDMYQGDLTDFDLPAYYNTDLQVPRYTSPILTPYLHSSWQPFNTYSDASATNLIWQQWPYTQWFANYFLDLDSVTLVDGGSGYTEAPEVNIIGNAEVPAVAQAVINGEGSVIAINILSAGSGYTQQPTITLSGGNGSGARALANMTNDLIRHFRTTMKFDRYQYQTQIQTWETTGTYVNGTLVRYDNRVWRAANSDGSSANVGPTFNLEDWQLVNAADLSGVDRTMGFYVPGVDQPGLELPLLIDGTEYPGVQVWGDLFAPENRLPWSPEHSYDAQAIVSYNGLYYKARVPVPAGYPPPDPRYWQPYVTQLLNAVYESSFTDTYLGTRSTDINVNGGEFVGPYEGHAPQELVNGAEFDTLDLRVNTRPGSDWQMDGHGGQIGEWRWQYRLGIEESYDWGSLVEYPANITVSNLTTGQQMTNAPASSSWTNAQSWLQDDVVTYLGHYYLALQGVPVGIDITNNSYWTTITVDYETNWSDRTITVLANGSVADGDVIVVQVYEMGGGSQLYRNVYQGSQLSSGYFDVPVASAQIESIAVLINGQALAVPVTWTPYIASQPWNVTNSYVLHAVVSNGGNYYRALQSVPPGIDISDAAYWLAFVPTLLSRVAFDSSLIPASGDMVTVVVLGTSYTNADDLIRGRSYTIATVGSTDWTLVGAVSSAVGVTFTATGPGSGTGVASSSYSWSAPQVQQSGVDLTAYVNSAIPLQNYIGGSNTINMIVNRNGVRLTPPAAIEEVGNGTRISFGLPQRLGASFSQQIIQNSDVEVYVDDILQVQGVDYNVSPWFVGQANPPGRQVQFVQAPDTGSRVTVAVWTLADYFVAGNTLYLDSVPNKGDIIQVITFNDTSEQELLTQIFVGPIQIGNAVVEPYDSTPYDSGAITGDPGSFDYANVNVQYANNFVLDRDMWGDGSTFQGGRLWVTLDGTRLFEGDGFYMQGNEIVLPTGTIGSNQVLAVTMFTDSIVPEASAFRIFQDMRGVQATYRITPQTSTVLTQSMGQLDDVIYCQDVSGLSQPDPAVNVLGVVMIEGERIAYRERDLVANTLSGLYRGTAGTAATSHTASVAVENMGRGNLLYEQYQDYDVRDTATADGSTTVFYAPSLSLGDYGDSSTIWAESLLVFVGGIRQYQYGSPNTSQYPWILTDFDPLAVEFITDADPVSPILPPPAGVEVTIMQRRGTWWYDISTPATRRLALQETDNVPARFLTNR